MLGIFEDVLRGGKLILGIFEDVLRGGKLILMIGIFEDVLRGGKLILILGIFENVLRGGKLILILGIFEDVLRGGKLILMLGIFEDVLRGGKLILILGTNILAYPYLLHSPLQMSQVVDANHSSNPLIINSYFFLSNAPSYLNHSQFQTLSSLPILILLHMYDLLAHVCIFLK
ncbi:hypothetical protein BsWGS_08155 [Bradybaena similaris]